MEALGSSSDQMEALGWATPLAKAPKHHVVVLLPRRDEVFSEVNLLHKKNMLKMPG